MPKQERFDDSRPQFRKLATKLSKVVVDERFASVLTDPKFQLGEPTKKGKKKKEQQTNEHLNEFYTISTDEKNEPTESTSEVPDENVLIDTHQSSTNTQKNKKGRKESEASEDPASRIAYLTALSRGMVDASSSSDEDDGSDSEDSSSDSSDESTTAQDDDEEVGILDPSTAEAVEMTEEASPYLAVMHLDWAHVRAVDIFAILLSFTAPGAVKNVTVYPSDFGMEKMKQEQLLGPVGIWKREPSSAQKSELHSDDADEDDDDDDLDGDDFPNEENIMKESDFDSEKLRAYEASKLRYYFAVATFSNAHYADVAYQQVDGMEFEHSSAAIDLRSVAVESLEDVINDRPVRDEATSLPTNYDPPEFVVNALQSSSIDCTWDTGDRERERVLTKYSTAGESWAELAENGDLKAYVASDASSMSGGEDDSADENEKAKNMRKMLGLDSDNEETGGDAAVGNSSSSDAEGSESEEEEAGGKKVTFIPKKPLDDAESTNKELSPWEKYQEKRKQKRREKRQATRERRRSVNKMRKGQVGESGDFLVEETSDDGDGIGDRFSAKQSKEELELLVAGDDMGDGERDFDMRGLERMEKNKEKKLRGARKRKEAKHAAAVTGTEFQVDVSDDRFKAVLDGNDGRFGIDRTDSRFRDTSGMQHIMKEQSRRRKEKRRKVEHDDAGDGAILTESKGSSAISTLVEKLKRKVA